MQCRLLLGVIAFAFALLSVAEEGRVGVLLLQFDKAPPHPESKYISVDADHLEVPAVAADKVLTWLRSLDQ